eukprot:symbB.v1.2.027210.t1/scaffold2775.1/size70737/2
MTSRLKLVGEKILCPLLIFCAESLKKTSVGAWLTGNDPEEVDAAEKLAVHRDMLRYVASQVACGGAEDKVWQKPFLKVWEETKEKVAVALLTKQSEDLMQLTELVEEVRWQANESQGIRRSAFEPKDAPQDQAELLPEDEIRWFKRRQSTQAYVQLRLCGAIGCAKDFLAMAASISRTQPRNFAPAFWMASYGLLLWGRARQLRPSLEIALRKRLIRAKFPEEEEEEESESEDDDDDLSDLEEDEGDMEEKEKPVPQFAIYGPHLIPLAEVLRLDWSKGPAGAPSQRVSVKEGEEPLPTGPVNMLRTEIVCKNVESLLAAYDVLTEDPDEDDIPAKSKETINLEEVSPDGEEEGDEEEDDPTSEVEEGEGGEDGQDDEFEDDVFLPEEAEGSAPSELSLFSRAELHVQRRAPFGLPAKLRLVKVFNGFHPDNATSIFPQAAGVLLLMHVSARKSKTAHKGHGEKESDWSEPLVDPSDLVQQLVEVELLLDSTVEARWLTNFTKLDPPCGDLMLSREPICSNPFACFMRSLMCVKVHHVGLLVKPEDFDETSYVRQAYPEMDATKMYVLHFLNSGLKLWDLERYIRRIREGCVPGMAYVRQLQWEQAEQRRAFQLQLDLAFEEFKNRGYEKSFLTSGGIAFCDAAPQTGDRWRCLLGVVLGAPNWPRCPSC